ncbi:MAG: SBBP repeat-containing protein, partial [Phycisphaerae bacterium]|nr:SBBP repeat-containing protein [Phycisphaerae bacterium]
MSKKSLISLVLLFSGVGPTMAADKTVDARRTRPLELYSAAPAAFIENAGQITDPTVCYVFRGSGANIFHTTKGPVFQLFQQEKPGQDSKNYSDEHAEFLGLGRHDKKDVIRRTHSFSMRFIGAKGVRPIGRGKQETKVNYFIGGDPNKWHTDVTTYSEVVYPELYDGISLHTFGRRSYLKYEFHVAAGADYRKIIVTYEGAGIKIDSTGALHVNTPLGELVDEVPCVYQIINGQQVQIPGRYRLIDEKSYTFEISGRVDTTTELVIDPSLSWSSYLGGNDDETAYDIAVDRNSGDALLAGVTNSVDFGGPYPRYYGSGGYYDAFVAKVNSSGVQWVAFLGGGGDDAARGVAVDPNGDVLLTGHTDSTDFPTTEGVYQDSHQGGTDAFVAKVSFDGSTLLWSTYLGGDYGDWGYDVAVDELGFCYVTGSTDSIHPVYHTCSFPTTPAAFQQWHAGVRDAFVTKLNGSLGHVNPDGWSSCLGGSGSDEGYGLAVDGSGNVLLTGATDSDDFGRDRAMNTNNGNCDTFVAMVTRHPTSPQHPYLCWTYYLGGSQRDKGRAIAVAVDVDGESSLLVPYALLTGLTESSDFPACCGFDSSYCGLKEAFVARINYDPDADPCNPVDPGYCELAWAGFLGGSVNDEGRGIDIIDADDAEQQLNPELEDYAVVTGDTNSYNFPTPGGFDPNYNGNNDAFVTRVTATGQLVWSSYLGGSGNDCGYGIAVDGEGSALVTGVTDSNDFPMQGGGDMEYNGGEDVFVAKIDMDEKVGLGKLYGTVWNPDGVPIGGAEVTVAGQMTLTDLKGQFSFDKDDNSHLTIDVFAGQTMVMVTKDTHYYPVTKIVTIDVNSTTRVNIQMTEKIQFPGDDPCVVDMRAKYCGPGRQDPYYMKGPSLCEKFIATIDWGTCEPNRVQWTTRGGVVYTDSLSSSTLGTVVGGRKITNHGRCFDMGGDDFGVGSGWVQVVAVGYKLGAGEVHSVPKRVDFFDVIEAPPYVRDANDSNLVKVEFTGNGFEYKVLKVPDFNLAPWDGSVVGSGMPVFGGENMNIGLDFKDEPKQSDSKLSASVSMDGTSFVFTKGCDGSTKREVHREVPVAGIELPELPGGVEVEASATADFYLTHEEGLEPPWRTGGTLNLGCTFSFSTPQVPGPPVCGIPTYTRADLSLELGLSSSLEGWIGTGPELSSLFYFEPLAKGILGAGVSDVACVEGYVGGGFHSEINLYPKPITWGDTYIILVGGVEVIIGPFSREVGLEYNWWFNPGAHKTITTSGFEVLPRNYLNSDAPLVLAVNERTIDCNVFPYSVPEVVRTGSGMLAVWIEDDIGRDANDRTELRYATYDGIDWTLRGPVFDDFTADMNPQLISLDDGRAACIWQDAKGTLADCNNLETLNEQLEVTVATFNGVSWTKEWSTNNTFLDRSPKLAVDENNASSMLAVWISNQDCNMWGDSTALNKIKWRKYSNGWDGADSTIDASFGMILGTALAYKDGIATYVFCRDADDDLNTPGDQTLWKVTYSDSTGGWTSA